MNALLPINYDAPVFSRIIHENVQMVQFHDRLSDALLATAKGADIADNSETPSSFLLYKSLRFLCILMLIEIHDRYIGTLSAKATATARPIPLSPPVIRATFPRSLSPATRGRSPDFGCGDISDCNPGWRSCV